MNCFESAVVDNPSLTKHLHFLGLVAINNLSELDLLPHQPFLPLLQLSLHLLTLLHFQVELLQQIVDNLLVVLRVQTCGNAAFNIKLFQRFGMAVALFFVSSRSSILAAGDCPFIFIVNFRFRLVSGRTGVGTSDCRLIDSLNKK